MFNCANIIQDGNIRSIRKINSLIYSCRSTLSVGQTQKFSTIVIIFKIASSTRSQSSQNTHLDGPRVLACPGQRQWVVSFCWRNHSQTILVYLISFRSMIFQYLRGFNCYHYQHVKPWLLSTCPPLYPEMRYTS